MNKITIKPSRKDLLVPNPDNQNKPLSEDGETVADSRYWKRRLKEGDVVKTKLVTKDTSKSKKS